jgi:uncharacterized membrane-anchored protein
MSNLKKLVLVLCCFAVALPSLVAQDSGSKPKLNKLEGPARADLGGVAQIDVPAGYIFLDGKSTRAMLRAAGEPVSGNELGFLKATNQHWAVYFEFDDVGYVKDDDKDKLNADKLLDSIKRGTEQGNKERERAGNPPLEIVGWEMPPTYDTNTHNLEWAIRATSGGNQILNYNTRLLGRKGVMEVVLVLEPENLTETLPSFQKVLAGYSFQTGQRYAEYRSGDKVAKYGLAALVVGGAAVGAAKLGLFAWLAVLFKKGAKLVIVAFVAVVAFFKRLLAKVFGGKSQPGTGP